MEWSVGIEWNFATLLMYFFHQNTVQQQRYFDLFLLILASNCKKLPTLCEVLKAGMQYIKSCKIVA